LCDEGAIQLLSDATARVVVSEGVGIGALSDGNKPVLGVPMISADTIAEAITIGIVAKRTAILQGANIDLVNVGDFIGILTPLPARKPVASIPMGMRFQQI